MARTLKSDKVLFWAALALLCTSVVMVVSAAAINGETTATKQLLYAFGGLTVLFVMMRVDYHHLRRQEIIWSLFGLTVLGLLAVFLFKDRNGAHRWIAIHNFTLQPSELAKLSAIFFIAALLERRMERIDDVPYALVPIGVVVGPLIPILVLRIDSSVSCGISSPCLSSAAMPISR